jgi:hypothetical protein
VIKVSWFINDEMLKMPLSAPHRHEQMPLMIQIITCITFVYSDKMRFQIWSLYVFSDQVGAFVVGEEVEMLPAVESFEGEWVVD